ncbi:N-acetylmuramoyl-L-alanine amidase CwlD [Bacillus kwashiorkori]|uniref:N-acetylmuramoyl-L-alanine amidase CwlD n=1 Tax=Bacillus kwashiorkori TaxID=1522318 RepID=UPI00078278C5|nr:N-acetylmuramoyl-L-alanine amidase CwlD [Bacillus kwashiorkori]
MKRIIISVLIIISVSLLFFFVKDIFFNKEATNTFHLPLSGKIIYLDPGHGGPDGGADNGKAVEKDIALSISKKLRDYLQGQGALVLMTRESDVDLADEGTRGLSRRKVQDLHRRAKMINESEAEFFVSIHLNSIPSSKWSGAQTFYNPRFVENKVAAQFIQEELIDNLENTTRKAKAIDSVYLVKTVKKPGVLVEAGFLSNPTERDLLLMDDYQEKVAVSIYEGIMRFFTDEKEERLKEETE